ncbi:unnamed protein product [Adineta ricciae]|uniref:Uncharacterized protein n=1 Tax=Adineta ricciae TaxID=249248 RepID=A0A813TRX9_ADIRI|nr:unnamed protein product [Adineta ricciae]CAF0866322.1 unnamed protein product [Adineta ricciae]
MYGTGMNPRMMNHYLRVAHEMNNYVASSAHNYYRTQTYSFLRDRRNFLTAYQPQTLMTAGVGNMLAYGLYALRMPQSVVNFGYRLGYMMDTHAVY